MIIRWLLFQTLLWLVWNNKAKAFHSSPPSGLRAGSFALALSSSKPGTQELESLSVCIVGAGPSGLLVAHRLAQAGANVRLVESRPRYNSTTTPNSSRAYALGIGRRGRTSIKSVDMDLWSEVKRQGFASERFDLYLPFGLKLRLRDVGDGEVPEEGRVVEPSILLYQNDLSRALLEELERRFGDNPAVQIHFGERVEHVDLTKQEIKTSSGLTFTFDVVLGCDGVNSVVRKSIDHHWNGFETVRQPIPGHFKVVRLDNMPDSLDSSAVALLLPKAGAVTAFVEPTKDGSCCILFAGRNSSDPLLSSSNTTKLESEIASRWSQLADADLAHAAQQLASTTNASTASSVKCNTFAYAHKAVLLGDAGHATGGVSGQGVNSALVDAMVLADMLVKFYDPSQKEASLRQSLLEYSIQQVAEAKALYDLSFGPTPSGAFQRLLVGIKTVRDSIFKGRFGIGRLPLQTKLTTSLVPFRDLRRERSRDFDEMFPSDEEFRRVLTELDSTIDD